MEMQSCSFYDNPSVCSDPRIDRIMTSTAQTVIVAPSTNFVTYTNNQYGFSIDYPSNWVINNKPDGNVGLEDKLIAPNFLVKVKTIQNTGSSFDQIASTYVNQGGIEGFPITVQSQDNVTIGNKEAYRIQYSEPTVSTSCRNEDYLINDGQFVHVIDRKSVV